MTIEEKVAELTAQLQEGDVGQRRRAVAGVAALLGEPACDAACRDALIALLRGVIEREPMITVRDDAEAALRAIPPQRIPSLLPDDRQHMLGVRCRKGHVTYFDGRRICTEKTPFVRTLVRDEAGRELDELALPCGTCGEITTVRVDCGGYR